MYLTTILNSSFSICLAYVMLEEGKKILGIWRWSPRYCSAMMEGFVVRAAPVSCTTPRLKQDKRDNEQR